MDFEFLYLLFSLISGPVETNGKLARFLFTPPFA